MGVHLQAAPGLAEMGQLITGFSLTIAISVVAELAIAGHLSKGPKTAADLARLCGVHEDYLRRVLPRQRTGVRGAAWRSVRPDRAVALVNPAPAGNVGYRR